ncbi:MAG TPA: ABC transporter ATP-binding protein [Terriglobales bacterium]|nr:ABC transporter ATP-binding protein [Terriglobales bacterium]
MIAWPANRVGEALEALARRSELRPKSMDLPMPPANAADDPRRLGLWIESAASALGLEAEPEEIRYADLETRLAGASPAVVRCSDGRLLALLDAGTVLGPDLEAHRLGAKAIAAELRAAVEAPLAREMDDLLESAAIPERRRESVRAALLRERLARARLGHAWLLRLPPGSSFRLQLRLARIPRRLAMLAGAHFIQYVLWLGAWFIVGVGALEGRLDRGLLLAWALLLLTLVPIRGVITWLQGLVSITAGGILKERLLYGALRLKPDEIRHQGAGQLLGRVIESEALESLALSGGFLALVSVIELVLAAAVLGAGAGGIGHALLLVLWVAMAAVLGWRYFQEERRWTDSRIGMTHDLVERMVGHRTRLAQEPREHWHDSEDQGLDRYQAVSQAVDRRGAMLMAVVPRGWLVVGLVGLAPAFVSGSPAAALAVSVGGMLLGYRAFRRLASGMWNLTEAAIAWKQVAPLFEAAAREELPGSPALATMEAAGEHEAVVEARDLVFRYPNQPEPVLQRCNLSISAGDRLLLEGPSGGGKSTLASLLTGVLRPESGLLLARGLDRQTLGSQGWLRRVASSPQFHENHVLTGTFAFNLLMGKDGWLTEKDHQEAEAICKELGLGPLLEKMPAGMLQMVGESGWQLSHGERSRLFIARALLQGSDLLVFDESFAALDPENLRLALNCVLGRAPTVMVIAHP